MGKMLEVWSMDSLQKMPDASPLQHASQVVKTLTVLDDLTARQINQWG